MHFVHRCQSLGTWKPGAIESLAVDSIWFSLVFNRCLYNPPSSNSQQGQLATTRCKTQRGFVRTLLWISKNNGVWAYQSWLFPSNKLRWQTRKSKSVTPFEFRSQNRSRISVYHGQKDIRQVKYAQTALSSSNPAASNDISMSSSWMMPVDRSACRK